MKNDSVNLCLYSSLSNTKKNSPTIAMNLNLDFADCFTGMTNKSHLENSFISCSEESVSMN